MAVNQNKRIFWAMEKVGLAPDGSTSFVAVHGVQNCGVTTTFNLTQVYELGQIAIYENIEDVPDIEVTLEKVLDGYPLIYHLATPDAASPTLVGRSATRCILAMNIYGDTQSSASGTPNTQMTCSGMYVSSLAYSFPVDGNFTESVTLVGNNKVWSTGSFTFTGNNFDNTDTPVSGVQRRQHFNFGNGANASILPNGAGGVPGINASGWNILGADGKYAAVVQSVNVSTDLGRENLLQLGTRNPFFRYATFPTEVKCDIEVLSSDGDLTDATEAGAAGNGNNLLAKRILISINEGVKLDLGSQNKLNNTTTSGGDAGGGNVTVTYSYTTFNELTVYSKSDPAGFAVP